MLKGILKRLWVIKMEEVKPLMQDETSRKYFNISTKWITNHFIENILKTLKELNAKSILDIGCGPGYITKKIINYLDIEIVGCDINKSHLSIARKIIRKELVIADVTKLPFKDSSFDAVIALEIIEHLNDVNAAISEIKRVSKNYVIITVPNEPFFRLANFLRGKNIKTLGNIPDHIHHFNKHSLEKVLSKHFSNVQVKNNAIFWITGISKLYEERI